ncbi:MULTISPECIES: PPE domain-containing protein [unclassified Nocardia]|uniref:PPE domain-containing protein n=1 Tax=unclassified Nocardia TaxID=2637762 RepID=UPI001CE3F01E|nr:MULTISPECIES: PPE domain-containing protein [unclassified Nocardia]
MIEPPQPGFTGVVWEAREPDRLTRELTTGPGAIPMAEAGATWTRLAASFAAAGIEYDQIINTLQGAWDSDTSGVVLDKISTLRDWLHDAARSAGENALHAEKQAAAYQLARLTMPNALDIEAIQQAQRALESIGAALGAPIKAVAAQTDSDADLAKAAASRVMRTYEAATEPLAIPWQQERPPTVATPVALAAEQAGAQAQPTVPTGTMPVGLVGGFAPPQIPLPPRTLTAYRAPVYAQAAHTTEEAEHHTVPITNQAAATTAAALPPGAMVPGAAGILSAQEQDYEPRASAVERTDAIGAELGIVSAPSVLGAPEPPTQTGQATAGGGA